MFDFMRLEESHLGAATISRRKSQTLVSSTIVVSNFLYLLLGAGLEAYTRFITVLLLTTAACYKEVGWPENQNIEVKQTKQLCRAEETAELCYNSLGRLSL